LKKGLVLIALITTVLVLGGCFGSSWIITLRSDGSGTIEMEYRIDKEIIQMMQSMGGEGGEIPAGNEDFVDEEELEGIAASLGEGVRFVSVAPKPDSDTSYGYTAVFEFDDINTLTVNPMAAAPGGGENEDDVTETPFRFRFTPGRTAELVVLIDQDEDTEEMAEDEAEMEMEAEGQDDETMTEMMKPYFESMSFLVQVNIDGEIHETNAHFRDGNSIILMDLDMGKIIDNDELFKQVMNSDDVSDEEMAARLEEAGIRIESEEEVTVRFR
jgi:hypothetical protein